MAASPLSEYSGVEPAAIRLAAMNLLARREHSLGELRRKLGRRFPDTGQVEEQLQRLVQDRLQSDERFAESFLRQRIERGHGPLRIREEMRQRAVDDETIQQAFSQTEVDWQEMAQAVLERKFGSDPSPDFHGRARRARFLQYRGFRPEHFRQLI